MNNNINLIIVAGGNQTRFKELSVFPKILLPTRSSSSLLKEFLDKIEKFASNIFLVINSKYKAMTEKYIEVNGLSNRVFLIETTKTNGSFFSLKDIESKLPNENLLFVWSDLNLSSIEPLIASCKAISSDGIIFTNSSGQYRYSVKTYLKAGLEKHLESVELSDVYLGNVPGIYFLKDKRLFSHKPLKTENVDLIDLINENQESFDFNVIDIVNDLRLSLVEYKSLDVYVDLVKKDFQANSMQTRFFNVLKINNADKTVEKLATDKKYNHLIQKEIKWYKKLIELNPNQTLSPKILDFYDNGFKMDYLEGYKPLHEILDEFESKCEISKIKKVYSNLFKTIDACSRLQSIDISFDQFKNDLKKEVLDKVIDRCESIKEMLVDYDVKELKETLKRNYELFVSFAKTSSDYDSKIDTIKYWFTHGDLNGSNTMVHPETLDVKFIDPRGYFGNTLLSGWKPYEYAKILYCLFGYDDFNLNPQIYKIDYPKPRLSLEYSDCKKKFNAIGGYETYLRLVGVIYIALAGYISQDIMKANIAYNYGMKMLKELV